jgi:hypothetical protein
MQNASRVLRAFLPPVPFQIYNLCLASSAHYHAHKMKQNVSTCLIHKTDTEQTYQAIREADGMTQTGKFMCLLTKPTNENSKGQ